MAEFNHQMLDSSKRPLVMGILNVTPDSFSDGGQFDAPAAALRHAKEMIAEGADIIDVGGESTRPGATFVEEQAELDRVLPVLDLLKDLHVLISIDTYKARVAAEAVKAGAQIVNDVWGLQKDPGMARVVADAGVPVIMVHNRTKVDETLDIMTDMEQFFDRSLKLARDAGIPVQHQILDPGFGFGKSLAQNYEILKRFSELKNYGFPVLAGASRKRMIGCILENDASDRMCGSLAVHTLALAGGAQIIRAHDVKAHADTTRIYQAMKELGSS